MLSFASVMMISSTSVQLQLTGTQRDGNKTKLYSSSRIHLIIKMRPNPFNNHLSISDFALSLHITGESKANIMPLIYQPNVLPEESVYVPFNAKFSIYQLRHGSRFNLPALIDVTRTLSSSRT